MEKIVLHETGPWCQKAGDSCYRPSQPGPSATALWAEGSPKELHTGLNARTTGTNKEKQAESGGFQSHAFFEFCFT